MRRKEFIKKIVLLLISLLIIVFIIINNFIGGSGRESNPSNSSAVEEGVEITYGEATRYLSFLFYNRDEMSELDRQSDSIYLDALLEEGVISNSDLTKELSSKVTCGMFRDMLWEVVELLALDYKQIRLSMPERLANVTEQDNLLETEFFTVYQEIINQLNNNQNTRFATKKLYILSESINNQIGTYHTQDMITYYTDCDYVSFHVNQYVEVLVCDNEILMQKRELEEEAKLSNVYLLEGHDESIRAYISTVECTFSTKLPLSDSFENVVGDLTVKDGVITGISLKPEMIHGKVLVSGEDEIEVEGYGVLPLHEDYRIYKVYGELAMESTNSILVGYSVTDFVVSEGKICAALIHDKIKAENIRVLINTTGYKSVFHKIVSFTSEDEFVIDDGKNAVTYKAGEKVTVGVDCKLMQYGRIKVYSTAEDGKIVLTSLERNYGNPKYRGSIEIAAGNQGLTVVNELSIEEYLYSVVPSEMPTSYGSEALKVQAVCARSYAYKQLMANKYSAYGAHVDDSVNCQVYNNVEENEASLLSVKDTYGQVLAANGNVITAYYFSTSCGYTANVEDVWGDAKSDFNLMGALQNDSNLSVDFSNEEQFRNFISNDVVEVWENNKNVAKKMETYDSGFLMYRWNVSIDLVALSSQINRLLEKEYDTNSNFILTYVGKVTDEDIAVMELKNRRIVQDLVFANQPVKSIGTVRDIQVAKRGASGIIKEMIIVGTEKTILLRYQSKVREFFAPANADIVRLDGSTISGMSLLPSAFCVFDPVLKDGTLTAFHITGGGFGHGVGMSQNGVKTMVKQGLNYQQILSHYYANSNLTVIYD